MSNTDSGIYHQRRQRLSRRRNRMIYQNQNPSQYEAELAVAEQEDGDIFLNMVEKSAAFFDTISMSDSVTPNPFISTSSINIKVNTPSELANPSIDLTTSDLKDARDASSTIASPHMLGHMLDAERQSASPVMSVKSILDSPVISVESIKILDPDHEQIVLGSAEHGLEEISLGSAEHEHGENDAGRLSGIPIQDEVERDPAVFQETQNASPTVTVKTNVTMDISDQALFDTDSEEIEEMEELDKIVDDVSTMTEETYPPMLSNFTPYSSKPFSFAETQAYGMQKQDELTAIRRRSLSAEKVYIQRLEEIAAQRSIMAQIAIKFEDVVMSVCGQEEEVLFLVVEEEEEEEEVVVAVEKESVTDNKSAPSKPKMICVPEANHDVLEMPIHEKVKEENTSMGMAGLLKTIEISRVGKLTTRDRTLVPLYERAVLDIVSLENQVMRKARAIEIGKRNLASCSRSIDKLKTATNVSFLEVEMKETQRKVVQSRESLQRLYEAFSPKTQKAIDDLQMDGFR